MLPPARTLAVVEFEDRNEAKVAFRKLAYKKFKNLPLYLEWAPENTFSEQLTKELLERKKKEKEESQKISAIKISDVGHQEENLAPTATVFVKNLNFETSNEGLKHAFQALNGLKSARISMKPNPKSQGEKMSMGFGFLEFATKDDALNCIKTMQKFVLDGHELQLKFSNSSTKTVTNNRKRSAFEERDDATKILVRNLPFEATKKDLQSLFA